MEELAWMSKTNKTPSTTYLNRRRYGHQIHSGIKDNDMFKFWKRKPVQQVTSPTDDLIRHIVSLPPDEWSVVDGALIHRSGMKVAWDIFSVKITVPADQGSNTPIAIEIPPSFSVPRSCVHVHYVTDKMNGDLRFADILTSMVRKLTTAEMVLWSFLTGKTTPFTIDELHRELKNTFTGEGWIRYNNQDPHLLLYRNESGLGVWLGNGFVLLIEKDRDIYV